MSVFPFSSICNCMCVFFAFCCFFFLVVVVVCGFFCVCVFLLFCIFCLVFGLLPLVPAWDLHLFPLE